MHVSIRPNFFGRKLVVFAALSTLFGVAMAQTADTPSTPQTSAPGAKLEHDHIHPLPTTEEIPASLPSLPSTPHPSASQEQSATLPQK